MPLKGTTRLRCDFSVMTNRSVRSLCTSYRQKYKSHKRESHKYKSYLSIKVKSHSVSIATIATLRCSSSTRTNTRLENLSMLSTYLIVDSRSYSFVLFQKYTSDQKLRNTLRRRQGRSTWSKNRNVVAGR